MSSFLAIFFYLKRSRDKISGRCLKQEIHQNRAVKIQMIHLNKKKFREEAIIRNFRLNFFRSTQIYSALF